MKLRVRFECAGCLAVEVRDENRYPKGWASLRTFGEDGESLAVCPECLAGLLSSSLEPTAREFAEWLSEADNPPCDVRQALKLLPVFMETRRPRPVG